MTQYPFLAQSKIAYLALSSCPYPMEILINLLFPREISYLAATFSTEGVGSTPGKSTKNIGTTLRDSSNTSSISKAGYSMNFSPILSITNWPKAEVNLSGLKALKSNSLWNLSTSLYALGKSAISAFSSWYHFFHCKYSVSKLPQKPAKRGIDSKALQEAQIWSLKNDLSTSGI